MTGTRNWEKKRHGASRWLAVVAVSFLVYAALMLAYAWARAWTMNLPPFGDYYGLDGPWDHIGAVEIPLHHALQAPLVAAAISAIAALLHPRNGARWALAATCVFTFWLLATTHYWLID